ncbi:MAG: toxic anion resistance protein [Clostridia bacterium]|nr:toxic anion resistance protein [Clostridia bacterium]
MERRSDTLVPSAEGDAQPFDILADRESVRQALRQSPEVEALTSTLDVYDLNSIVTFGRGAAEALSTAADEVLKSVSSGDQDSSQALFEALSRVMQQFREDELEENTSFFGRFFGGSRSLDKVIDKYTAMSADVDRIYVQLRQYEEQIRQSNERLEALFQANVATYHELEKYIVAAEIGLQEIDDYIAELRERQQIQRSQDVDFELQTLEQAKNMLKSRHQDLMLSEQVALQAVPMIRLAQNNNMTLARRINASLIVTLPVFKHSLAQAILLKRQKNQMQALDALNRSTNAMLKRNRRDSETLLAAQSGQQGVSQDTLSETYRAIMSGISESRRLQEDAKAKRAEDERRLKEIQAAYRTKIG